MVKRILSTDDDYKTVFRSALNVASEILGITAMATQQITSEYIDTPGSSAAAAAAAVWRIVEVSYHWSHECSGTVHHKCTHARAACGTESEIRRNLNTHNSISDDGLSCSEIAIEARKINRRI